MNRIATFPCHRSNGFGMLIVVLCCLTATVSAQTVEQEQAKKPHIVIFLADDLGWKDVGYHGSEIQTPHIDSLATAGVRLEQFYVQPVCSPTRSSLMTGRYPIRQGLQVGVIRPWAEYGLPLEERTLAQALKETGYRTAITGKWHLGEYRPAYLPRQRGFDHQYGHYLGGMGYFTHERDGGLDWHRDGKALREEGYSTNLIGREAVRIIEEHDPAQPLFLYVAFNAPHTPYEVPDEYLDRYKHIERTRRRQFAAMVTCLDDAVSGVLKALDKRGMRGNTIIFFCSDNGGASHTIGAANNEPLRGRKGTLYEGGVRVPALVVWPDKLKGGRIVDELFHIVDLYPTFLNLAGGSLDQPLPLDGLDAWPTIAEGKPSPRTEILHNLEPRRAAIRRGNWKLIRSKRISDKSWTSELFNIADDPYEKTNLANKRLDKLEELSYRLGYYAAQAAPAKTSGPKKPPGFKTPKVWGERD